MSQRTPPQSTAFTIVEILTTLVILAILVSVAGPTYRKYVARAEILEAKNVLDGVKLKVEQYYIENRTMPSNLAALGLTNSEFSHIPLITNFGIINSGCSLAGAYAGTWCMYLDLNSNKTQTAADGKLIYSTSITADQKISWRCTTHAGLDNHAIPLKLMPDGCVVPG